MPTRARGACRAGLTEVGLRKRAGDVFTMDLDYPDVVGRVGLSAATNGADGRFELAPVVGVHHGGIESARATLMGRKKHPYDPATVLSSIGYLTPEQSYRAWFFEAGTDMEREARDMAAAVKQYGVPFMEAHGSLEQIIDDLERCRHAGQDSRKTRLPIAYELDGRPDQADAALQEELDRIETATHLAAQEFRTFVDQFRRTYR